MFTLTIILAMKKIPVEEKILIEKCKSGVREAFGSLMKIYRRRLYSYLFKLTGDSADTEDVFQETLIKIWKGLPEYNNRNRFSSWIFSIAHNTAMDHLRKKMRERNFEEITDETVNFHESWDFSDELHITEIKKQIGIAVDKLSGKQKNVFLLRIHSGMSFKEIAEVTGDPLNTVLSHMRYAVIKLKKNLRMYNE